MSPTREARYDRFMTRWIPRAWGAIAVVVVMLLAYGALLKWGPMQTPLVFRSITVESPQTAGHPFTYNVSYCRFVGLNVSVNVTRDLIGQNGTAYSYPYPAVQSVTKAGCGDVNIPLDLPGDIHPGTYSLAVVAEFPAPNLLRGPTSVTATSNVFTIK